MVTANHNVNIRFRESGARVIKRKIDDIGHAANNATRGIFLIQRALFVLGGAGILRGLVRQLDMLTEYENRLKLTATSAENLQEVQTELFQIAIRSRSAFEGIADIYTRTALSVRELGISQKETLQFTESLAKATIISGASAREANAAMVQLGQGMASNRLSGDELRSVLEQLPFVADVIAKSLGVTRGALREFGREGKLSTLAVLKAFREAREEIDEKFAATIATVSQAMTIFHTRFLIFLDDFDDTSSASSAAAKSIIFLSENFTLLANSAALAGVAITASIANLGAKKLFAYVIGLKNATVANLAFNKAVVSGDIVLFNSAAAEHAKAMATLSSSQAQVKSTTTTIAQIEATIINTRAKITNLEVQKAEVAFSALSGQARNLATGQYVSQTAAIANNTVVANALKLAKVDLAKAELALAGTSGTALKARLALTAAESRAIAVSASFHTPLAKLSRTFPLLTAGIIGTRNALASMMAWMAANPVFVLIIALTSLFVMMNKVKKISEKTKIAFDFVSSSIDEIKQSAVDAINPLEAIAEKLESMSRTEAIDAQIKALDNWGNSVEAVKMAIRTLVVTTQTNLFNLEELNKINDSFINNTISMEDYITALDKLGSTTADDEIRRMTLRLITVAKESEDSRLALNQLTAYIRYLNDEASDADLILLGMSNSLDSVRSSANGAAGAIAQLNQFIPKMAALAKIEGQLAEAGEILATGQAALRADFNNGQSIDQFASKMENLNSVYREAVSEIDGTADATRNATESLSDYTDQAILAGKTGLERTLFNLADDYANELEILEKGNGTLAQRNLLEENYAKIVAGARADAARKGGGGSVSADLASLLGLMQQEIDLLGLTAQERTITNGLLELEKELKRSLTEEEAAYATELIKTLEATKTQASVLQSIVGPREQAANNLAALNQLYIEGKIGIDDYTASLREMKVAAAEAEGTLSGGFMAAIGGAIMSAQEFGGALGGIVVDAAGRAADAIVEFATTGKINIRSFFYDLFAQLLKLAANQLFLQLIGSAFGVPMAGASGLGGLLGDIFGGASGASMAPSGPGSTDSQFVAFNKRPDERVDILTPGQQAAQQNNLNSGNGNSGSTTVQTNLAVAVVLNENDIGDILDGKVGDTFIVRGIERNSTSVKRVISR